MKLIYNKEEFETKYSKYAGNKLPDKYPCIVYIVHYDGGLGGPYTNLKISEIPTTVTDPHHYFVGFSTGYKERECL